MFERIPRRRANMQTGGDAFAQAGCPVEFHGRRHERVAREIEPSEGSEQSAAEAGERRPAEGDSENEQSFCKDDQRPDASRHGQRPAELGQPSIDPQPALRRAHLSLELAHDGSPCTRSAHGPAICGPHIWIPHLSLYRSPAARRTDSPQKQPWRRPVGICVLWRNPHHRPT